MTAAGARAKDDSLLTAMVVARLHAAGLTAVSSRRLGDARGLYHAGDRAPFGLVWMGQVYLKAGPETVTRYVACSMRPLPPGPASDAARLLDTARGGAGGPPKTGGVGDARGARRAAVGTAAVETAAPPQAQKQ